MIGYINTNTVAKMKLHNTNCISLSKLCVDFVDSSKVDYLKGTRLEVNKESTLKLSFPLNYCKSNVKQNSSSHL